MGLLKALLKFVLLAALLFLLLRAVDFSVAQSIVLVALAWGAYEAFSWLHARTHKASLSPYRVIVYPRLGHLLLDYRLIKDTDELQKLYTIWDKHQEFSISFTILELKTSGDWLVYSNDHKAFVTEIDFEEDIEPLAFRSVLDKQQPLPLYLRDSQCKTDAVFGPISPRFYFRERADGYEIGLNVRDDWWEDVCRQNPGADFAKTKVDINHLTGEARLGIATVPQAAFAPFLTNTSDLAQFQKVWSLMDSELAKYGWKREKDDPDAEIHDPWIRIENKYFGLQYRGV
jgi:hypothetical protein